MAENLNVGAMIKSRTTGQLMADNDTIEKYCWNDDPNYCDGTADKDKYGGFYEWSEAFQDYSGQQPSTQVQGICPAAWHIPSKDEYNTLIHQLGGNEIAGEKVKISGESNFEAICTGYHCTVNAKYLNSPGGATKSLFYWSSIQSDAKNAHFFEMKENSSSFTECQYSPMLKSIDATVRCVRN